MALVALGAVRSRAQATQWLYPDADSSEARRNLRQLLHRARDLLEGSGEQLQLRSRTLIDVLPASEQGPHIRERSAQLLGAMRYDALPDLQAWLDAERARLHAAWLDALADTAAREEREGRLEEALGSSERIVAEQPLSEHAHRRVMRLHYLRGDRAAALEAFERCERIIKDELSVRPSGETLAFLAQIESSRLPPAGTPRRVPATVLRPPLLIGRADEWRTFGESWDAGINVSLTGSAGLGKTRLLTDFERTVRAEEGRTLVVSARPGDDRLPQVVLSRLLRGVLGLRTREIPPGIREEIATLLPEWGQAGETRHHPARFMNAVESLVDDASTDGLQGIFVDDLQFADDASLEAIEHLAAGSKIKWVVALRDAELSNAARRLLDSLSQSSSLCSVVLQPLDRDDVHAFVGSLGIAEVDADVWSDALHQRCGGNPLFLLETVKALVSRGAGSVPGAATLRGLPVTTNVGTLIERRISQLSSSAVTLARCAAVAGQDFSAALASHVLQTEPLALADGWAELEAAQILRDGSFAHDLIYEAALASVPGPIASELHARIARFLAAGSAAPIRIAEHAETGGLFAFAAQHWQRAGEQAESAGRLVDAAHFFAAAGRNHEQSGDFDQAFASYWAECEALVIHAIDDGVGERLAKLASVATTPAQQLVALRLRAHHCVRRGEYDQSVALCHHGLGLLAQAPDPAMHLRLAGDLAGAYGLLDCADKAIEALLPCELWVATEGSAMDRMQYAGLMGQALEKAGRVPEALASYARSLEIARAQKRPEDVAVLLAAMGIARHSIGEATEAFGLLGQSVALLGETQRGLRSMSLLQAEFVRAKFAIELGRYSEAIPALESLTEEFGAHGVSGHRATCQAILALANLRLGQFARVAQALARTDASVDRNVRLLTLAIRVESAHARGATLDGFAPAVSDLVAGCSASVLHATTPWRCRLVPGEEGIDMLSKTLEWARATGQHGLALGVHVRWSELARAAGNAAAASDHADEAMALAPNHYAWMQYRGDLYLQTALAFDAARMSTKADAAIEAGLDWLRVALTHVTGEFRPSFLERNTVNRDLLAMARQRGAAPMF